MHHTPLYFIVEKRLHIVIPYYFLSINKLILYLHFQAELPPLQLPAGTYNPVNKRVVYVGK